MVNASLPRILEIDTNVCTDKETETVKTKYSKLRDPESHPHIRDSTVE